MTLIHLGQIPVGHYVPLLEFDQGLKYLDRAPQHLICCPRSLLAGDWLFGKFVSVQELLHDGRQFDWLRLRSVR
jgi:hypothetical protein